MSIFFLLFFEMKVGRQMLNFEMIRHYAGDRLFFQTDRMMIFSPHPALRSHIASYTLTDPSEMPEQETVLPTVSNTLVYSINEAEMIGGLRGVNTEPTIIGEYAKRFPFLLLVEFQPGGFYPFSGIKQQLLVNQGFDFETLLPVIDSKIRVGYQRSNAVDDLLVELDRIFLEQLDDSLRNPAIHYAMEKVVHSRGMISCKSLAAEVFYSEQQLNRLFRTQVGVNVHQFSRIVRLKTTLHLLEQSQSLMEMAVKTGHYDAAHYSRDFKQIYQMTPREYQKKMSIFYNDPFKLSSYTNR